MSQVEQLGLFPKLRQVFDDAQERLLHYLFGILPLPDDPHGHAVHVPLVTSDQGLKCVKVALLGTMHKFTVVVRCLGHADYCSVAGEGQERGSEQRAGLDSSAAAPPTGQATCPCHKLCVDKDLTHATPIKLHIAYSI